MDDIETFSRIVSRVHTAATRPDGWLAALGDIAWHLEATAASLIVGNGAAREVSATTMTPEATTAYVEHYAPLDFVAAAFESIPVGLVAGGWELGRRNLTTEFYNDWQYRHEMTDGLFVRLAVPVPTYLVISAAPRDHPFATAHRLRYLDALVPHVDAALRTQAMLTGRARRIRDLGAALDTVEHGVVLLDGGGRVVAMNAAATAIVSAADGLVCSGEKLVASTATGGLDLPTALEAAALHRSSPKRPRVGSQVVCRRTDGSRPLLLRVVPLPDPGDARAAQVAVLVIDLDRRAAPAPAELLRSVFGLTRAEATVAEHLLAGRPPATIADELVVSLATVRTHIGRIFTKTGTHRQADFVRLCSSLSDPTSA